MMLDVWICFLRAALSIAILVGAGATTAATGDVDPATARRHVNLAGLQSMLAEQMAKAACFAHLGVHEEAQKLYLAGAYDLFTHTQSGLREGSDALGLAAETHPNLIQALDRVDRATELWRAAIKAVAPAEVAVTADLVGRLARQTAQVTEKTDALAERTARTYAAGEGLPLDLALKIELASRQRMLSQRIAKNVCLIAAGIEAEAARTELVEAKTLFEASLDALIDGYPAFGLAPETDPERRPQLDYVRRVWADTEPLAAEAVAGRPLDEAALREVAWSNVLILSRTNAVVFSYETGGTAN